MPKKVKKFSNLKKSLRDFVKDEDGFVSRKNMLKIGLGTITALGVMGSMSGFAAEIDRTIHTNSAVLREIPGTGCLELSAEHSNHSVHIDHAAY